MSLKGLDTTKSNSFSSYQVQEINTTTLSARISNNTYFGDVVLEINQIALQNRDNLFVAYLLSSVTIVSIVSYTPQNIQNDNSRSLEEISNTSSTEENITPSIITPALSRNLNNNSECETPRSKRNRIKILKLSKLHRTYYRQT